ncbi:MAG: hypothetical protein OQK98_12405 [Gammaproteobacteria bacterium]|nr:hypothetical protein [Gammaproteobacteria bacterium]
MKLLFRGIFSPILKLFESDTGDYLYKKSHRVVLIVMGIFFTGLASLVYSLGQGEDIIYIIPVIVFGGTGLLSLLIGILGEDRAVAKIWGSGINNR